jgi:release factor glutamine methyltransferase
MLPTFRVLALDKSLRALEVARQNIDFHRCASRVFPLCGDLLSPLKKQMTAVVANLPYISTAVLAKLQPEVAKYEPRVALDGGADGLRLLTPLAERATDYLLEGGMVALEVGEGQARRIEAILASNPRIKRTEVISDYGGIERVVVGFC